MTDTNVFSFVQPGTFSDPLTEVLRDGARTLLAHRPIDAGRLRPLHIIGNERFERYPDVLSTADLKLDVPPLSSWNGIYTTGATPLEVRHRVSEVIREVVASEKMKAYIAKGGAQALYAPVEAMEALQIDQIATYRKAMEISGLQPQ